MSNHTRYRSEVRKRGQRLENKRQEEVEASVDDRQREANLPPKA
jgi:hypothetical protein